MKRHVVLVGLPGAGKTTVGRLAARALGARFVDLDDRIEREQGMTVAEIFAARGEAEFRALERAAAEAVIDGPACVLAPGGGWAAQPGAMDSARERCLVVYLRTQPHVAARRVGDAPTRPLLAGQDAAARITDLLRARGDFYERAEVTVATDDRTPDAVAGEVVTLARSRAGW